ncbi:hypothetical protein GCM10007963_15720 [Lutibacter litoralis]|nr:hypothetical protein GCM10007963_15720 [Lutibacter litoralis]
MKLEKIIKTYDLRIEPGKFFRQINTKMTNSRFYQNYKDLKVQTVQFKKID